MKHILITSCILVSGMIGLKAQSSQTIYDRPEAMPAYQGCENETNEGKRYNCTATKIGEFVAQNLHYPAAAREAGIEGTVIVSFVVEVDGSVSNLEVTTDIGGGCGEEAIRVMSLLPGFTPGSSEGHPVRVKFLQPVEFRLN